MTETLTLDFTMSAEAVEILALEIPCQVIVELPSNRDRVVRVLAWGFASAEAVLEDLRSIVGPDHVIHPVIDVQEDPA